MYTFKDNYNESTIEYKKPIYTKNPVKKNPIIDKIKVKKPIILPTSYKEEKIINLDSDFSNTKYDNIYLDSTANQANYNIEYLATIDHSNNNEYNIISDDNNTFNVFSYGTKPESIINNKIYNTITYNQNSNFLNNENNVYNTKNHMIRSISYNNLINYPYFTNSDYYNYNTFTEKTTSTIEDTSYNNNNTLYNEENIIITNDNNYNYDYPVVSDKNYLDLNSNNANENYHLFDVNNQNDYLTEDINEELNSKYQNITIEVENNSKNINYLDDIYDYNQYYYTNNNNKDNENKKIKIKKIKKFNKRRYSPKKIPIDENNDSSKGKNIEHFHKVKITKKIESNTPKIEKSSLKKDKINNDYHKKKNNKVKVFLYPKKTMDDKMSNINNDSKNNYNGLEKINLKKINDKLNSNDFHFNKISDIKHQNELDTSNNSKQNEDNKKIIETKLQDINNNKEGKNIIIKEEQKEINENKKYNLDELDNNLQHHEKFIQKMENMIDF